MTFFFDFVEVILLVFIAIDSLGYLAEFRKKSKGDERDCLRICFTWVFFLIFRSISCSTCSGIIGHFYGMLMLLSKLYVTIPLLGGTRKLYEIVIEKNMLPGCIKEIFVNFKNQTQINEEHRKNE